MIFRIASGRDLSAAACILAFLLCCLMDRNCTADNRNSLTRRSMAMHICEPNWKRSRETHTEEQCHTKRETLNAIMNAMLCITNICIHDGVSGALSWGASGYVASPLVMVWHIACLGGTLQNLMSLCVCMFVSCVSQCVCVCASGWLCLHVCVCVCVCAHVNFVFLLHCLCFAC